ncbi:sulfite oxidase heme-binding subunit YedZ [Inmirania thermothiophila]|uniref:Protein-methionine-sulfoxide reductase heme-binding subunit MsrQ n=1 Tax=Inmirania thermothiophila TaxID=1750597 RepID=A0A3N1Y1T2_9GAMM|nr:protein-methionine-sulfoxide reductase heme-binding subunit MsrQ [Inmirania thermothiophila]ROR32794.1 sulfoxide reductase heme-binding subunit YedZ [Inmirania thermothiophila]
MRSPDPGKAALFLLCLLPLGGLLWDAASGGLGANPVEALSRRTGDWTLRLLLATLAVTPLRRLAGWRWIARQRRMLGLFAFFYACLHVANYLVLDQWLEWAEIVADVLERPWVTVGAVGFLLLVPLAATSTDAALRRLGGRRWKRLHRAVYLAAGLGVLHYLWLVKADLTPPLAYGAVLAVLLLARLPLAAALRPALGAPSGR